MCPSISLTPGKRSKAGHVGMGVETGSHALHVLFGGIFPVVKTGAQRFSSHTCCDPFVTWSRNGPGRDALLCWREHDQSDADYDEDRNAHQFSP